MSLPLLGSIIRYTTPILVAVLLVLALCSELVLSRVSESGPDLIIDPASNITESFAEFDPFSLNPLDVRSNIPGTTDPASKRAKPPTDAGANQSPVDPESIAQPLAVAQAGGQLAGEEDNPRRTSGKGKGNVGGQIAGEEGKERPPGGKAPRSRSSLDGGITQFTAFVWIDSNFDGLLNEKEKGAKNAKVTLFTLGRDGIANNRDDVRIIRGATNALGIFRFQYLRGGAYYLKITKPIGWSVTGWHKGKDGLLGSDAGYGGRTPVFIAYASDGSIEFRDKAVPLTRDAGFMRPGLPKGISPPIIAIGLVPRPAAYIPFIVAATVPLWFDDDDDDDPFVSGLRPIP